MKNLKYILMSFLMVSTMDLMSMEEVYSPAILRERAQERFVAQRCSSAHEASPEQTRKTFEVMELNYRANQAEKLENARLRAAGIIKHPKLTALQMYRRLQERNEFEARQDRIAYLNYDLKQ